MTEKMAIVLILLLPAAWGIVFLIRYLMRGGASSNPSKDGSLLTSQWELKQRGALHRGDPEHEEMWAEDDWLKKDKPDSGHVYPVHTTKMDHLKKVHHVGEEKEAHFPEVKVTGKKKPPPK
jgi:hypothetical protein